MIRIDTDTLSHIQTLLLKGQFEARLRLSVRSKTQAGISKPLANKKKVYFISQVLLKIRVSLRLLSSFLGAVSFHWISKLQTFRLQAIQREKERHRHIHMFLASVTEGISWQDLNFNCRIIGTHIRSPSRIINTVILCQHYQGICFFGFIALIFPAFTSEALEQTHNV